MATVREGSPFVSHGRGGAANVTRDDQPYADAGIVRESDGTAGGSTGRGGTGNMAPSPAPAASSTAAEKQAEGSASPAPNSSSGTGGVSVDTVSQLNMRYAPTNFHVGRGGEGNEVHNAADAQADADGNVHHHEGAAQRFKEMLLRKEGKP